MNKDLEKELGDVVDKHLSKVGADALKRRLDDADGMEIKLAANKEAKKDSDKKIIDLQTALEGKTKQYDELKKSEDHVENENLRLEELKRALSEQAQTMEVTLLKKELEMTLSSKEETKSLINVVFKNATVRESVLTTGGEQMGMTAYDEKIGMHIWVPTGAPDPNKTETKTTEKL